MFILHACLAIRLWYARLTSSGNNPLKQYAEDFMPNVLDPFAKSMQWMLWLAFFSVVLILINVMVQTLTPFKQVQ